MGKGAEAVVRGAALVLGLALSACAVAPRSVPRDASGNGSGEDRAAPPAVLSGRPVTRDELVTHWFDRFRESYWTTLVDLVDERLAREEAAEVGLAVPPAALDQAVAEEVRAREEQWRTAYGPSADLASAVREAYGLDVEGWKSRVLRPRLEARLLRDRVVRADGHRRVQLSVRVIVVEDPAHAETLRQKLLAGADFARTAQQESKDPTARVGGALPLVARGDLARRDVEDRLFAAPPGSLVGPLEVDLAGRRAYAVYKVIRALPPWSLAPGAWGASVEADLAERPPERAELEAWRRRRRRERGVAYFAPDGTAIHPPGG